MSSLVITPLEILPTNKSSIYKEVVNIDEHPLVSQKQPIIVNDNTLDENILIGKNIDWELANKILSKKYYKSLNRIMTLENQVASLSISKFTDDEMRALVAKPFKTFISLFQGKFRNKIYEFHMKEKDFDWGYDMKMNFSDYFQMHYERQNIKDISVTCKQKECEILAIEKQKGAWEKIMRDIDQQPWFKFSLTTIFSRSNDDDTLTIYTRLTEDPVY